MKFGKMELIISVPKNIEEVLNGNEDISTNCYDGLIPSNVLKQRENCFKERLFKIAADVV
jgi:hypothetical protein